MPIDLRARRASYVFLSAVPILAIVFAAPRALRIPVVYQLIGAVLFAVILLASWILGARAIRTGTDEKRTLVLAGGLLVVPFALISLFWVGLGPPWVATPVENRMRYLVLLVSSIAVTGAFVVLKEALSGAGEHLYSTLGFAGALVAGSAYLVWMSVLVGAYVAKVRDGQLSAGINPMIDVFDILLLVACVLTYLATAAFAASFKRAGWLGRGAARTYVAVSLTALLCLVLRGLSSPDPNALSSPWYLEPGFVAGIPAIPFIMPFLLGVVLLRLAGDRTT